MPADAIAIFDLKQDGSTRPAKKQKVTQKRPGKLLVRILGQTLAIISKQLFIWMIQS